jgi:hypothetical protein
MTTKTDYRAIIQRITQIVEVLSSRYICAGWKLDVEGAERALKYFQRRAAGKRGNSTEEEAAIHWLCEHGQNLDWVLAGDMSGFIGDGAAQSKQAERAARRAA